MNCVSIIEQFGEFTIFITSSKEQDYTNIYGWIFLKKSDGPCFICCSNSVQKFFSDFQSCTCSKILKTFSSSFNFEGTMSINMRALVKYTQHP